MIDFIDPPLWPAFNLADVAIVAGVALLARDHVAPTAPMQPAPTELTVPPEAAGARLDAWLAEALGRLARRRRSG